MASPLKHMTPTALRVCEHEVNFPKLTAEEIADQVGVNINTVYNYRKDPIYKAHREMLLKEKWADAVGIAQETMMETGRNGYNCGHVGACCRGERKTHHGYKWRYLDGTTFENLN